ncbi:MAG: hypothetical protein EOM26_05140 [Alphaproteobacteria bacterium]|nr:hypothetical protein [Alphaproteobacteria bacterium]
MLIDHVNIVVSDLNKSVAFYERLGFDTVHRDILEGRWISDIVGLPDVKGEYAKLKFPGTETALELMQYFRPEGGADPQAGEPNRKGLHHMAFRVENIEEIVGRLKGASVTFFSDIQEYAPAKKKLVYFYGPDNVVLEFCQYG